MKKAMFLWFLSFIFFGVFTLGGHVNAELMNFGKFTRDTDTGLYWLDMSLSKNVSAAKIIAGMDSRCLSCLGWRHATVSEIQTLLEHAGMTPPFGGSSPWNSTGAQLVINLLGNTGSNTTPPCASNVYIMAFAVEGQPPPPADSLYMPVVIASICPEGSFGGADLPGQLNSSLAHWLTQGNWLVKESTEPPDCVGIDIKPGSEPNSINSKSQGVIPVAILTTDTFDASTVDPSLVLFGATGSEAAPVQSALEDVDGDGDIDMILHFKTQETGIQSGDISASLTGGTFSGQIIQGSDCIKTVGYKMCFPPPAGLTGWWPGDGNTDDIIGGRNAELRDNAITGPGLVDQAFFLDGDGDFVDVPHDEALNVGTGDFTVDLWVLFNNTEGEQILVEKWVQRLNPSEEFPGSTGWTLTKLEDNRLLLAMEDGSGAGTEVASDVLPIATGTWTHFAATRQGSQVTLFMNGVPVAQGESSLNLDSISSLKFGHRGNPNDTPNSEDDRGFFLNGRIDEVELFIGQALTHCQIQAIFNAGSAGKCK
jgi:hypothetical protein